MDHDAKATVGATEAANDESIPRSSIHARNGLLPTKRVKNLGNFSVSAYFRFGVEWHLRCNEGGMLKNLLATSFVGLALVVVGQGCSAEVGSEEPSTSPSTTPDESAEALSGGQLACTVSTIASTGAFVGTVACWIGAAYSGGAASPVCVWLSSAGVTAAKLANGAAQCATGCGLAGAACQNIAQSFSGRAPSTARIVNTGCTKGGFFSAEADVCGLGLNRFYARDAPESRQCVVGKATGFPALSDSEKAYIRNPANCKARGFGN